MATLSPTEQKRLGRVRPELFQAVLALNDAANEQLGFTLAIPEYGGIRTTAQQAALYADALAQGGGTDTAYAVAKPGHGRHEVGAAVDEHIVAGGSNADGTGSDDDYRQLAELAESLPLELGLTAGYFFADRGVGKKDPYHFQLNEPLQTSIDRWRAMQAAGIVKALAVFVAAAAIGRVVLG